MNSEDEQHRNYNALLRFGKYWEVKGRIKWFKVGTRIFRARIWYWINDKKRELITDVHINQDGDVYLAEVGWLNADDHYTLFNPHFQTYRLTKRRRTLRIRHWARNKMGGPYRLDIRPLMSKNAP
jgi:hypothetical protein